MSKSVHPAASATEAHGPASHVRRSNVIPFPVRPRAVHPYYCSADRDPLATPELETHSLGICELAYSIAAAVTGYDAADASDHAGEARHELAYADALDMLVKLTPMLVEYSRQHQLSPVM